MMRGYNKNTGALEAPKEPTMSADLALILATARPGDSLTITTGGKARTVTVTEVAERYLYVTSGKVRPSHTGGGMVDTRWGTYQPTLQQQAKRIEAVARCAVLAFAR
jgi:hypothetical protein